MEEKVLPSVVEDANLPQKDSRSQRSSTRYIIVAILAIMLLSKWLKVPWAIHSQNNATVPCHQGISGLHSYSGENVSWTSCGEVAGRPLECSEISVPMDQFNATNSGDKTFSISLIRLRAHNDTAQNLLLNPGGPGGSGVEFVFRRGKQLSEIVGEGFHLLSFDPRGINGSKPNANCYPTQEARRKLSSVRSSEVVHDSPELFAWTHNFVQACADTLGEHGKYINTPQTAADMNSILDAIGQQDMVYWGFSYGTLLGQTYASLYPNRSARVIIDGVVNAFNWYGDVQYDESFTDTENVLDGFFSECIKAGVENCTLSSLGSSKEELRKQVFDFSAKLKEQPLNVYINNTSHGLLTWTDIWYTGIFPALYKPASWYTVSQNLAMLLKGNATAAWRAWGGGDGFGLEGEANTVVSMNDALTGPAYWPQDRKSLLKEIVELTNRSIFAPTENDGYYTRQQWVVPRTHNFTQDYDVETAHPLLILSTSYDPICPLVSAKAAQTAFKDSQIVEVEGYGHCSVAVTSNCLAKHVRDFLYNGKLPDKYTKCEVDGPYFVRPEEDGKVRALKSFDTAEEEKIHLAQLELARDWQWPVAVRQVARP
ncbi:Carboxylesterase A [Lecanosticta acicola]|uniref:Carboxylesterase A n=1 Tax=Lecanosticta acicola TaxID=111012 RepID=A0AAI9E6N7_9PEZI|nr:Carboxylesterase A [Lecanosticta acicola]